MLERRAAIATLMANRPKDMFVVPGLGSTTYDMASLGEKDSDFYLWGAMGGAAMIGLGLALARPELKIWAFMGDGAFCMNPGMLMVERQMNLPNLTHILVSNRVYGATSNAELPNFTDNDYAAIARAMGLERVFEFRDLDVLERDFPSVASSNSSGHTFVVLEVQPFSDAEQQLEQPPFDGPELKYRFGRHIETRTGCEVFGYHI